VVIYARNIRLIHKQKRRDAREAASQDRESHEDADLDAALHPPQDRGADEDNNEPGEDR
jgi:hypothetical protein